MKAYIIHLPGREFSNAHAATMKNELRGFGFDAELFPGTEGTIAAARYAENNRNLWPYSIKNFVLDYDETRRVLQTLLPDSFFVDYDIQLSKKSQWNDTDINKVTRDGVKGCFDSHYRLWKKCIELNQPIAVFEDDVKFFRGYTSIDFDDVLVVSIGKTAWQEEPYKTFLEIPDSTPRPMPWKNYSMPGTSGYIIKPHACRRLVKHYRDWYLPADNAINKGLVNIQIHSHLMGRHMHEDEGNISAI